MPLEFFIDEDMRRNPLTAEEKAEISNAKGEIGMVLNDNFEIGCKNKSIKILSIQREGKKIQNINEFVLGTKIKKGTCII